MANVSDLLNDIMIEVPEVPQPLALRHMQKAIVEFFKESTAYRKDYTGMTTIPNVSVYRLPIDATLRMVRPLVVHTVDGYLDPTSKKLLAREDPEWRTREGTPEYFMKASETEIQLYPTPNQVGVMELSVEIAVTYLRNVTTILDDHAEKYLDAFVDGALGYLFELQGKPWSNVNLAEYHKMQFRQAISDAEAEANGDDLPKIRLMSYGGI